MIAVAGESLIDLITEASDQLTPITGGAAFNVARVLAWLGVDCELITRLSSDPFGARLRAELLAAGVRLPIAGLADVPTTLAVAQLDVAGSADYTFYGEGTAAAQLRPQDLPSGLLDGVRAMTLGGLGLVLEPTRSTLLGLALGAPAEVALVLDPNCRPSTIRDRDLYRDTIAALLPRTGILKVSREDIGILDPGAEPIAFALDALGRGPAVVIVTDGAEPTLLATAEGVRWIPVPAVEVADTIGAGDAFLAGLLAWFAGNSAVDPRTADLAMLAAATETAAEVAAAVCTMRGAVLPAGFTWRELV
jgi:fructokinase